MSRASSLIVYPVRSQGTPDAEGRVLLGYTQYREKVTGRPDGTALRVEGFDVDGRESDRNLYGGIHVSEVEFKMARLDERKRARLVRRLDLATDPAQRATLTERLRLVGERIEAREAAIAERMDGQRQQAIQTHRQMRKTGAPSSNRGTESFRPVPEPGEAL